MTDTGWKFERDGLLILVSKSAQRALVVWEGTSDSRDLNGFLEGVLQRAAKELADVAVTVDLRKLQYMNSATVAPLINLVRALDVTSTEVVVLFSHAEWQRTHFQCMKAIARTLQRVQVERKSGP